MYKNSSERKYFNKLNRPFFGYSLIEVLISISIMALLVGLGYANLRGYQQKRQLDNTADMIKADLSLARESALAGKKPAGTDCEPSDRILRGYRVTISSTSYKIEAECYDSSTIYKVETKNISLSGVTLSTPPSILFYPVAKGTNITAAGGTVITITQTSTTKTTTVTVLPSGEIH